MRKTFFRVALMAVALCGFTACDDEDKDVPEPDLGGITDDGGRQLQLLHLLPYQLLKILIVLLLKLLYLLFLYVLLCF